ncbi:MAG TPA: hypothetical protein VMR34_04130 [Candidatus Saccharimonadales bacterium]|nr:hypothetical protein [Candidatus Saccharimonadales bacterium]
MPQREGFPTAVQEQAHEAEQILNPMQIGAEWLMERGVGLDVAGIQLVGPNAACRGTLAEMVGMPGHSEMKSSVELIITEAQNVGKDPAEAVTDGIKFFAKRDDKGEIVRVSADELKKK